MITVFGLLALWLLPVLTFLWSRCRAPRWRWRLTGISLGMVIAPASTGLYGLYHVGPLVALLGLVGLPLTLFHGVPGFELATAFGLREPRTVVQGIEHVYIILLNSVVWSVVYGGLGWVIDTLVHRRLLRAQAT